MHCNSLLFDSISQKSAYSHLFGSDNPLVSVYNFDNNGIFIDEGRIKNYAKSNNIAAQVVLPNYMFECFLARLSASEYNKKFVVKGGMLIAAIVGLDIRSTMDLDTTLRNIPLTEDKISDAINTICEIDMKDAVVFTVKSIEPIRKDDIYGGYRVRLDAAYDKDIYKEMLKATAEHRKSIEQISDVEDILKQISESDDFKDMW